MKVSGPRSGCIIKSNLVQIHVKYYLHEIQIIYVKMDEKLQETSASTGSTSVKAFILCPFTIKRIVFSDIDGPTCISVLADHGSNVNILSSKPFLS